MVMNIFARGDAEGEINANKIIKICCYYIPLLRVLRASACQNLLVFKILILIRRDAKSCVST